MHTRLDYTSALSYRSIVALSIVSCQAGKTSSKINFIVLVDTGLSPFLSLRNVLQIAIRYCSGVLLPADSLSNCTLPLLPSGPGDPGADPLDDVRLPLPAPANGALNGACPCPCTSPPCPCPLLIVAVGDNAPPLDGMACRFCCEPCVVRNHEFGLGPFCSDG